MKIAFVLLADLFKGVSKDIIKRMLQSGCYKACPSHLSIRISTDRGIPKGQQRVAAHDQLGRRP